MDTVIPLELYQNVVDTIQDDCMTCYSLVTTNKCIMNSISRNLMSHILFNRNIKCILNATTEFDSLDSLNKRGNFSFKTWEEANSTLLHIIATYNFNINVCNFVADTNGGQSICDKLDQFCLVKFMKESLPNHNVVSSENWGSLFWHADNIKHVCTSGGVNVPEWFSTKYSALLAH